MTEPQTTITFNDGAAYERMMGKWSQLVGAPFLHWLAPRSGMRWVDIGCGNGAFTEMIVERCAPASIDAIDPSDAQLAFARSRPGAALATFRTGDAMALPFPDQAFDAAVMALVIFFVPEPAKGVAEMVRVVRPGGLVSAYAWDMRGGFPLNAVWEEMLGMGVAPLLPPSASASRIESLKALWTGAGLEAVETKEIVVERTFADFGTFWQLALSMHAGAQIAGMNAADRQELQRRVEARLPVDAAGRIAFSARANAVKGRRHA